MAPVLVTGLQGLLDQQPAKTRAVDEKIGFDDFAVGHLHTGHETALRVTKDLRDLAFDTLHTPLRDLGTLMGSVVEAVGLAAARCVDGPPAQARALAADALCQAVLQAYAQTAVAGGLWPDAAAFEADAPLRRLFEHAALPASWRQDAGSRTDADPNADPNADTDADPDGGALDRTGMRAGDTSASAPRTDSRTHP